MKTAMRRSMSVGGYVAGWQQIVVVRILARRLDPLIERRPGISVPPTLDYLASSRPVVYLVARPSGMDIDAYPLSGLLGLGWVLVEILIAVSPDRNRAGLDKSRMAFVRALLVQPLAVAEMRAAGRVRWVERIVVPWVNAP